VLGRDIVIDARNTAFNQRPEAFNRVRMHISAHVNFRRVMDAPVAESHVSQRIVEPRFIRKDCGRRYDTPHNMRQNVRRLRGRRNDLRDNLAATFDHPENRSLALESRLTPYPLREMFVSVFAAEIRFIKFDFARQFPAIIAQRIAKSIEHAPRGFIGNAQFTSKLFSGDAASGACDQVHRIEPKMQGRGRLVEDRPRSRMQMMAARHTRPRLPLLSCVVTPKRAGFVALRTMRVLAVGRQTIVPKPRQARLIVRELPHELHQRVMRVRRGATQRILSISCGHEKRLADGIYTVKGYLPT
jgi:hypothetical protein